MACLGPDSTVISERRYSPTNTRKSYRKKLESKTIAARPNLDGTVKLVTCTQGFFATFHHAYALMDGVRALMPPQGALVVAAYMPQAWEVHLDDKNVRPVSRRELAWAGITYYAIS